MRILSLSFQGVAVSMLAVNAAAGGLLWPGVETGPGMQLAPTPRAVQSAAETDTDPGTVAVIPFTNISGDDADDWIGDGIAETVMADLESQALLTVIAREQVQSLLDGQGSEIDDLATLALGRKLGARWVVTGGYQRLGDQLRITARMVDAESGVVVQTLKADGALAQIFDLQDQIARELTTDVQLDTTLRSTPARIPAPGSSEPVAGGITLPRDNQAALAERASDAERVAPGEVGNFGVSPRATEAPPAPAPGTAVSAGILAGRVVVTAGRADEVPLIDGQLDDAIWQRATRITEFVQRNPIEGAPATEDTEVYVAYDDTHLYFGLYAHYSDPSMVRANRVDRDQANYRDDTISFYFDTFLDQQRAYVFTLNGYGVQGDSLMGSSGGGSGRGGGGSRGGRSSMMGGMSGGSTSAPRGDSSWDALFDSGGTLVEDGWTAEMAIPFKSLRYPSVGGGQAHRWGFQIARSIRGKDETAVWAPTSRDVSGFLPQMGLLEGLSGLSTSRNLEILPTVTAVQVGNLDTATGGFPREEQPEGGLNVKYGITPNLTLDATFNPDFSQIESDRPQIEVNQRFPLFFSELRPFFLEGQEIFSLSAPVNLVHTRTIVDPRYGGKVTGKVGDMTVGFLVANDEAPGKLDDVTDPAYGQTANVMIGRVRYDLYAESHIGIIATDREFSNAYSRVGGVDGNFRLSDATSVGFQAVTSSNRDRDLLATSGQMFNVALNSQGRNLSYGVSGYTIDPEFDTAVGFIRRRDMKALTSQIGYRFWPESWLINWGPTASYGRNYDFNDVLEDENRNLGVNFSFAKSISLGAGVSRDMERFAGVNFDKTGYFARLSVSTLRQVSIFGFFNFGDQVYFSNTPFLGTGSRGSLSLNLNPFSRLQSRISATTSRLVDPLNDTEVFDIKIYRAQSTFQFTERFLLRNILEYNDYDHTVGANLLLTYRVNSGTVFYVGYDDHYQQGDLIEDASGNAAYLGNSEFFTTDLLRTNRAFFTKISYLFRY